MFVCLFCFYLLFHLPVLFRFFKNFLLGAGTARVRGGYGWGTGRIGLREAELGCMM